MAVEYSPDGRRLAVAGGGGGVGVWDAESGQRLGRLLRLPRGALCSNNPDNVQALAFGDGGLLAAATTGGTTPARALYGSGTWTERELIRHAPAPAALRARAGLQPGRRRSSRSRSASRSPGDATGSRSATSPAASGSPGCLPTTRSARSRSRRTAACSRAGQLDGSVLIVGDGRLEPGGGAAGLRPRRSPIGGLLSGRPHAGDVARRRRGRALGRRVAAADRLAAAGSGGRLGHGALHARRPSPVRGLPTTGARSAGRSIRRPGQRHACAVATAG